MNKIFSMLILIAITIPIHPAYAKGQEPILLVNKLDWKILTHSLPLNGHEKLKSGSGKLKQLWKIKGQEFGHFEIIGNDQNDADIVGWSCSEYDKQGNLVKEISKKLRYADSSAL